MNYFKGIATLDELKKEYKRLAMINHPDRGGSTEAMQMINAQYDKTFKMIQNGKIAKGESIDLNETPEQFREALEKIIHLFGIDIEICGDWIWVSGNTYAHKEILKGAGYKWRSKKQMWSFGELTGRNHKPWTHEQIQTTYGSQKIVSSTKYAIA